MGSGDYYAQKTWEGDRQSFVRRDYERMKNLLENFIDNSTDYTKEQFIIDSKRVLNNLEDPGEYSY